MALNITLQPGESVVINGAVISSPMNHRLKICVENKADVLRSSEIMKIEEATTVEKEIYFLIQTCILNPAIRDQVIPHIHDKMVLAMKSGSSAICGMIMEASTAVSIADFYKALKLARQIMAHSAS
jgi:flagellar protein FlbT